MFNRNSKLTEFESPDGSVLKLKVLSEDKSTIYLDNIASSPVVNYKGQTILGVRKSTISKNDISRFSSVIKDNIENEKLTTFISWYWDDDDPDENYIVKEEKIVFNTMESSINKNYESLVSRVKFENTSCNNLSHWQ